MSGDSFRPVPYCTTAIHASRENSVRCPTLDGEVCVLDDDGRSDFDRLQAHAQYRGWYQGADLVAYCVFDVLVARAKDIRQQPFERRKAELTRLLRKPPAGLLNVESVEDGQWPYGHALALGLDGVVGKRAGSTYRAGERSRDWVTVKRPGSNAFANT